MAATPCSSSCCLNIGIGAGALKYIGGVQDINEKQMNNSQDNLFTFVFEIISTPNLYLIFLIKTKSIEKNTDTYPWLKKRRESICFYTSSYN